MRLRSKQQLDKVGTHTVPVLTTPMPTVGTSCVLGVILNSMSSHISAVPFSYCQLCQLRPIVYGHYLSMPEQASPGRSFRHALITATDFYSMALLMTTYVVYGQCRMLRHTSSKPPAITTLANLSLQTGKFPARFKSAQVLPLLKKPGLDRSLPVNYRPISNLSTVSKVL